MVTINFAVFEKLSNHLDKRIALTVSFFVDWISDFLTRESVILNVQYVKLCTFSDLDNNSFFTGNNYISG